MRETIFEYKPEGETCEYILVEANNDGGAVIRVSGVSGGLPGRPLQRHIVRRYNHVKLEAANIIHHPIHLIAVSGWL
jgi:hypothetical protein